MEKRPSLTRRFLEFYVRTVADSRRLTTFYRGLNKAVGGIGVILGLVVLVPYMKWSRLALGLPLGEASLEGIRLQFLCWVLALLLAIPICIYGGAMLVAGVLASALAATGKLSREEAIAYTLYSRYPVHWFRKDMGGIP